MTPVFGSVVLVLVVSSRPIDLSFMCFLTTIVIVTRYLCKTLLSLQGIGTAGHTDQKDTFLFMVLFSFVYNRSSFSLVITNCRYLTYYDYSLVIILLRLDINT